MVLERSDCQSACIYYAATYICFDFLLQVSSDLPFICPSEVDLLNRLCKLGTYYKDFNDFIQKHGGTLSMKNSGNIKKAYNMFFRACSLIKESRQWVFLRF